MDKRIRHSWDKNVLKTNEANKRITSKPIDMIPESVTLSSERIRQTGAQGFGKRETERSRKVCISK